MKTPQKLKNRVIMQSNNPTSGYISKRNENRISKRHLHSRVHCSVIHNSQNVKTTELSTHGLMNKENVVYTCSGISFSFTKKEILVLGTTWMELEAMK